ncbi:MAG: 4-hydroxy-tetrahydrodipicolinate synthase [Alphaproteobacteria bacterium]|jgi:4-hydroxy-tetrahydrodipicolinate synthase|nr:4-hydroxy-tetrahydrodipicolinate synthase [Alphaproteobacteria bacterium]MBP9877202.1 4-hydroxy-tetrahydrodipicolinate synthase [Alphaproteobacteria bacterium]
MFEGYYTALITPFKDNKIDEDAFQKMIERQIKAGVTGVVPCGTTGEAPTLSISEHYRIFDLTMEVAKGKCQVIAGTGSNHTAHSIETTKYAKEVGADAVLSVAPYYNKPTQRGIYAHFEAIHDAVDIPIILYNVPSRTNVNMSFDTVCALAELPRIKAIKDCSGDITMPLKYRQALGNDFKVLTGDDPVAGAYFAHGGDGCVSVASNLVPELCVQFYKAWKEADIATFTKIRDQLAPLSDILFCETSPGPVKYAASLMGLCRDDVRLPLVTTTEESKEAIQDVMKKLHLLTHETSAIASFADSSGYPMQFS